MSFAFLGPGYFPEEFNPISTAQTADDESEEDKAHRKEGAK